MTLAQNVAYMRFTLGLAEATLPVYTAINFEQRQILHAGEPYIIYFDENNPPSHSSCGFLRFYSVVTRGNKIKHLQKHV